MDGSNRNGDFSLFFVLAKKIGRKERKRSKKDARFCQNDRSVKMTEMTENLVGTMLWIAWIFETARC